MASFKGFLQSLRLMFPMAQAKRELAEIKRHRDMVPLSAGEQRSRELMLAGAQDRGEMVAMVGTENRIAQMVAEQTRGFRAKQSELEGHIATLSERIMYLEQPNRPKRGERGSGTGVFPRGRIVSGEPELAGRPGTIRDAAVEMIQGESARAVPPSEHPMRRDDGTRSGAIGRDAQGKFISSDSKTDPYLQTR